MDYLYFTGQFKLEPQYKFEFELQMPRYENIVFDRVDCPPREEMVLPKLTTEYGIKKKSLHVLVVTHCDLEQQWNSPNIKLAFRGRFYTL
jgi:hypothetical protein